MLLCKIRMMYSTKYKHWVAVIDPKTCRNCVYFCGKIYRIDESVIPEPQIHQHCRCYIEIMEAVYAGTVTRKGAEGADWWLKYKGKLPDYYISLDEARKQGWDSQTGNLHIKCPGKMIFRGVFQNRKGTLPSAPGRVWYEADINYSFGHRNKERILFSNDGLMFVTKDHYYTFKEII